MTKEKSELLVFFIEI